MKLRRFLALLLTALLCLSITACGEKEPTYSPTKSPYAMKWECNAPQIAAENGEIHFYFMSGEGMIASPDNEKGQFDQAIAAMKNVVAGNNVANAAAVIEALTAQQK